MLTLEQLKEIKERADKATPGPWRASTECNNVHDCVVFSEREFLGNVGGDAGEESQSIAFDFEIADTHFIAHAREDIPALLHHIKVLEKAAIHAIAMLPGPYTAEAIMKDDPGRSAMQRGLDAGVKTGASLWWHVCELIEWAEAEVSKEEQNNVTKEEKRAHD